MKTLICEKDIAVLIQNGEKNLCIDADAIITPSAKDAAHAKGITISCSCGEAGSTGLCQAGSADSETIYLALKSMMEKGVLNGAFDSSCSQTPYSAQNDPSGFKLISGSSVKMETLDTGKPGDRAYYQELIGRPDHSSMNAGFMTIERSDFDWDVTCEEIYYIVEGTLTVSINGKVYTAHPGDSLYCPKGVKVTWGSSDKVKVFYATY